MPKIEDLNLVALIVGIIGVGGLGAFLREIAGILTLWRSGVAAKEGNRKTDLVTQRDRAVEKQLQAEDRADQEAAGRRLLQEYASLCRRIMVENGLEPKVPAWPRQLRDFNAIDDDTGPTDIVRGAVNYGDD